MTLRVITAPVAQPVTLDEVKLHLRETETAQDRLIESLIKSATAYAENYTRRAFVPRTLELTLDGFPGSNVIMLPQPPAVSVTHIKYVDFDGTLQTVATTVYDVDSYREPGRIQPAYLESWPTDLRGDMNGVQVRYVAGYSAAGTAQDAASGVPEELKHWVKVRVADLYENRENFTVANGQRIDMPRATIDGLLDGLIVNLF